MPLPVAARRAAAGRRAREPRGPSPRRRGDRLHRPGGVAGLQRGRRLHRRRRVPAALDRGGEPETASDELIAAAEDAGLRLDAFLAARGAAPSRAAAAAADRARRGHGGRPRAAQEPQDRGGGEGGRGGAGRRGRAGRAGARFPSRSSTRTSTCSWSTSPRAWSPTRRPGHRGPTLAEALAGRWPPGARTRSAPGIVHRLDRDTSGLLVVARSDEAHAALQKMMQAREIDARVHSRWWRGTPTPTAAPSTRRSAATAATGP